MNTSQARVLQVISVPSMHALLSQRRLRRVGHALRRDTTDLCRQNVQNQLTKPDSRWTQLIMSDCALIFRRDASIENDLRLRYSCGGANILCKCTCPLSFCTLKHLSPILNFFRPSGSPIIEAFGTPCTDTKFQGEPLHWGRLIHGGWKNWRFLTEMADISETVRDRMMVTMER